VEPDYFTTALTQSQVSILDPMGDKLLAQGELAHGDIKVVESVTGFKKIKFFTHENAGYGDVFLPDMELSTTGVWWTPDERHSAGRWPRALIVDALHGAGNALKTVSSIALMCEPEDIGRSLGPSDGVSDGQHARDVELELYRPTLFLFDSLPGGVGLARRIFERAEELMLRAAALIRGCACNGGCPACIGPSLSANEGTTSERKHLAAQLLTGFSRVDA
jgi:DEAD/DEAH box helicase domain-containing protein